VTNDHPRHRYRRGRHDPHRRAQNYAIRRFFAVLFEEFEKPGMSFELLRKEVCDDTAYIVWTAETADNRFEVGTDTFIVQNGKILTKLLRGRFRRSTDLGLHGFQQGVGMIRILFNIVYPPSETARCVRAFCAH
jgi:hypothetical protein